jgi:hypothetical protein
VCVCVCVTVCAVPAWQSLVREWPCNIDVYDYLRVSSNSARHMIRVPLWPARLHRIESVLPGCQGDF